MDDQRISRRRLIGTGLAAGAGAVGADLATGAEADAKARHKAKPKKKKPSETHTADVCVVGAGISGLTAARQLHMAGKSVIVLEARNRVGGRCYSIPIPGASDVANMGATFVGPTQTDVLQLMGELGIGKFDVYSDGDLIFYQNGQAQRYSGTIPPVDPVSLVQLDLALNNIDSMAQTVPVDAPWEAPMASTWDRETVWTWILANVNTTEGQQLVDLAVNAILSEQSWDVSLLYFLWYVNQAGGTSALIGNAGTGGAQDYRVSGGCQLISVTMAGQLGVGKRVLLNNPVRTITQNARGATVHADHATVNCKQVIVAIPPTLSGAITYEPQLTAARRQLVQRLPVGSLIKTIAVYDTPFWRGEGLNGQVTTLDGPVGVMFDASPASGTPGVLLGFIDGDDARALDDASPAQRKAAALQSYVNYFGSQAANPKYYYDLVWAQEIWSGGCPVGVAPPGVLTEFGAALRAPIGRIHWAGTETATAWVGYMSGGVNAGKRAASEVIAAL